ncbi:hypothetical protein DRO91_05100 [Candidatus Heimdallarchaeota archaeon]|nr:MAG: hypothetical protein DRO91_05100 [Candidatus Heimdallarchaeota archaeon]
MANGPVLTWRCDPLLYDPQAVSADAWLTANKLIEQGQLERIFYDPAALKLELYPILVRKVDFLQERQSDRILARFPFKVLTEDEIAAINDRLLSLAEQVHHYFYRSIDFSIRSWREKLRHYLERGALPFPLLRCLWKINPELVHYPQDSVIFESARGKRYTIPCKITKQLVYLCGVVNGDGHLRTHWLRIVDETKEHIQFLSQLFMQLFSDGGVIFQSGNAWNVEIRSSQAVRLFHFLTDQTINGAKYGSLREPVFFQLLDQPYRSLYWRGVMDADGSYKNQISFGSASKRYISDFQLFLRSVGIKSSITTMKTGTFLLQIPLDFKLPFARQIGVHNPKKKRDLKNLLNKKSLIFNGLREEHITREGYFDLSKLTPLYVLGLEAYLKAYRKPLSYAAVERKLGLSSGQYYHYEHGTRALPFPLLFKLFDLKEPNTLMKKLVALPGKLLFRALTSRPHPLPLKPTQELLFVMSHLLPLTNWTRILQPTKQLYQAIERLFEVEPVKKHIRDKLLLRFLQTFGDYRKIEIGIFRNLISY